MVGDGVALGDIVQRYGCPALPIILRAHKGRLGCQAHAGQHPVGTEGIYGQLGKAARGQALVDRAVGPGPPAVIGDPAAVGVAAHV